jgi:chromosome segregation ATPase
MKHFISTTLLLITFLTSNLNAQQISSANYNKEFIHEDFSQEGEHFKIVTTTDNYFILDKGDYLLSRNSNESEYAIIANKSSASNFILKTAVRLGPSNNKKASIGIVLKVQQDGKGAIIFEINKKGEYRIKQLLGNTYKKLSGNSKHEGWIKSKTINGVDEHNFIEIRTENNLYDVYVYSDNLTTFFIPDYDNGSCGLIISPETKARVAYYHIDTKGENTIPTTSYVDENTSNTNTTIEELNRKITTLETNNEKLNFLNTEARENQEEELASLREKNNDQAGISIEQEKEIASLNRSITDFKNSNLKVEELEKIITEKTTLIINLTEEKSAVSTEFTKLNEIITRLNTKNTKLAAVSIEQENKIKIFKNSETNSNASIASLESKNQELNNRITDLNTKNADFATVTIEQEKEINNLKNSTSNADQAITKLNNENEESILKINSLNTKNVDLAAVTIEQEKEIVSLQSAIKDLKSKSTSVSSTNKQLTENIDALKQQITLEKSVSTNLTNDLNKVNKSSNNKIKKLTTEVNTLKNQLNTTININTSLTANLAAEKITHSKTKNGLSNSVKNKAAKIKALEAQLNTTNQQLKSANKNSALVKECAKNEVTLTAELKNTNQEISVLRNIKNKQDSIVKHLNIQLTLLKAKQLELNTEVQALNIKTSNLETNNVELKELFILKDFEVNGVKPSELTKQTNTYPTPKEIKGASTIYAVQFGVFMQVQVYSSLKALDDVWYETTEQGTYVYLSGEFKNPQEATAHKNKVAALGYPNSFVVTLTK